MSRMLIACLLGLMVSGCAIVGSDAPLFEAGDAGPPPLRPGLWAMPDDKCQFDPAQPPDSWPGCANATLVEPGRITGGLGKKDKPPEAIAYVLTRGEPRVLQLQAPPSRKPDEPAYVYAALEPVRSDAEGRIVEAHVWLALCFKPPLDPTSKTTPEPFAGLTMHKGDSFCRPSGKDAVRNAARLSRDVAVDGHNLWLTGRWIRDGDR